MINKHYLPITVNVGVTELKRLIEEHLKKFPWVESISDISFQIHQQYDNPPEFTGVEVKVELRAQVGGR